LPSGEYLLCIAMSPTAWAAGRTQEVMMEKHTIFAGHFAGLMAMNVLV